MLEPLQVETLRIPSSTDELMRVDILTEDIARSMGFDDSARADLGICVTEAVNNAIVHAHHRRADLPVEIRFERYPDCLRVSVRDYGDGFDAAGVADPTEQENLLKVTGRGVHLIRALMDGLEFHSLDVGMEVVMTKRRK
jgi:serine/threonine-protein kinase RsbW